MQYPDIKADDQRKVIDEALERFQLCYDAERHNRERALEAIRFRDLEQWPENIKNERENDPDGARPCLVLDKTNQHIRQVTNDQRQNRPAIKIRPVDDDADPKTAEMLQGMIRNIESQSNADHAYDTAFEQSVDGGYGYWRILSEYVDDESFDQELRIRRIRNRFCVYLDPARQEPDGSDSEYGFVVDTLNENDFKAEYPDANVIDWNAVDKAHLDWMMKDKIRVAEYYKFKKEYTTLEKGGKSRKVLKKTLCWYKLTSAEILDYRELPGKYIPIVECIGNEIDIEGESKKSGLIRASMDAARMYNYAGSAFVEMVALAPKAPFVAADGQVEDHEDEWAAANRRNIAVLKYKPISLDDTIVPPPQRQQMQGIPAGWDRALGHFEHDIQSSMGMYAPNLGNVGNAKSGKQEMLQQREGDTGTYHFIDNLSRSLMHTGRILIDLIPKYYDTERVIRILGDDGASDMVRLNPNMQETYRAYRDNEGNKQELYNPSVGRYDVTVSVGPSYTSKRQEAAENMAQILQGSPNLMGLIGDLYFRNQDFPYAEEIADRLRKTVPPQLLESDEDIPPEVEAAMAMLKQKEAELGQRTELLAQAEQEIQGKMAELSTVKEQAKTQAEKTQISERVMKMEEELIRTRIEKEGLKLDAKMNEMKQTEHMAMKAVAEMQGCDDLKAFVSSQTELLTQAIQGLIALQTAPRKSTLIVDDNGNPVGAVSEVTIQ